MEENVLGYICEELARLNRRNVRIENKLNKQKSFSLLAAIVIFGIVCKVASIDKKIKALEPEGESV